LVDVIRIVGLTVMGAHGALDEEQHRLQPFRVDADISLDLSAAGCSDALSDTVDYGKLTSTLAEIVRSEHYCLMERLGTRLAEACLDDERVVSATVEVTKLRPPVPEALESAAVRVTRSRHM
jgi:dihydroneopterin aldolase